MTEYTPGEVKYKLATANEAIGEMALTYINELEQINFRLQGENKQLKIDYNNLEKALSLCNASNSLNKEQLFKAEDIIHNIIRVTWGEGWSYSLDWKVRAESFLKEIGE